MTDKALRNIHGDIIELSILGNEKAQFELYSLYSRAMFNICMRMLPTREEAEDALQEAFTEVFDKLSSFRFESSFGAWVKRIVINRCLNKLKYLQKELSFNEALDFVPGNEDSVEEMEENEFRVKEIYEAVKKLPEGYRTILNLYLFEGYDHAEIAEILNINEVTSRTQYFKAKRKVIELINKK